MMTMAVPAGSEVQRVMRGDPTSAAPKQTNNNQSNNKNNSSNMIKLPKIINIHHNMNMQVGEVLD